MKQIEVTPESADWTYLGFSVVEVGPSNPWSATFDGREAAIVPLQGAGVARFAGIEAELARSSVFEELAPIVYLPPDEAVEVTSDSSFTFAVGSAPAEGKYPARIIEVPEQRSEIRGGGQAYRQVVHSIAPPVEAERLIVYQVYVPRGTWSGWAPHCHDGRDGSPYLEETYYFRLDRPEGWAMHRNWRFDEDYEDLSVAYDGDVVLVPKGYHSSVACPGANMYFLNFLAGELLDDNRSTPPCFHADYTWIEADWTAGEWNLPIVPTT
ncbi:MAG: 5-deoxy-glucuronate isomerase [Actinomycetia bacterium]|nr:5-deoxy-glucuronate isomerase [Actinomycetes bacterium]MCP4960098.1 5-deoxy-glucuronate isomerase [Actinomycetes bacterium]